MESEEASTAKLRLMCSYGGHILPRPGTNSLFYAGGETRILSIQHRTLATLSSFRTHLSTLLSLKYPFTLKYQLPHLHLDSLISLASDEDLHILVDEYHNSSSRIRLFVFPAFRHPKTESWFLDSLKSSSIMHHSFPLDTTSSFASSLLPPSLPSSLPSDSTVSSIISQRQNTCYQDSVLHVSEATLSAQTVQVESQNLFVSNNANLNARYSSFPRFNSVVQSATRNLPLHAPLNSLPTGHCIYQQSRPSTHLVYQTNPICPVYLVPVTLPMTASTQASMNLNLSSIGSRVPRNSTSDSQNYLTHTETAALVHVPYNENQAPQIDVSPMHHIQSQSQNISITSVESAESGNELDNNLTRDQIYKSQPPPPALPSKHQTVRKATPELLSEALAQLHVDSLKPQHTEISQPH
ncbi:hypothetical protein LR48_Vigan102s003700 [Vigna angularis]|uniref:PB1 domain-containing protein n=2 Tax=Phaseolus angularis TaxID=3914 RepID=A0A0L9T5J2_PHAAN|nr:uncharacterized protein LOC108318981 [Vigna angularis]KOM25379.1 hypothetical protein LR48_Vigan102s003700 [Vigna angularis]BAU00910.1 hypothetical protein VIGAN_11004800 [Vigna angularis var. angularis]